MDREAQSLYVNFFILIALLTVLWIVYINVSNLFAQSLPKRRQQCRCQFAPSQLFEHLLTLHRISSRPEGSKALLSSCLFPRMSRDRASATVAAIFFARALLKAALGAARHVVRNRTVLSTCSRQTTLGRVVAAGRAESC